MLLYDGVARLDARPIHRRSFRCILSRTPAAWALVTCRRLEEDLIAAVGDRTPKVSRIMQVAIGRSEEGQSLVGCSRVMLRFTTGQEIKRTIRQADGEGRPRPPWPPAAGWHCPGEKGECLRGGGLRMVFPDLYYRCLASATPNWHVWGILGVAVTTMTRRRSFSQFLRSCRAPLSLPCKQMHCSTVPAVVAGQSRRRDVGTGDWLPTRRSDPKAGDRAVEQVSGSRITIDLNTDVINGGPEKATRRLPASGDGGTRPLADSCGHLAQRR